MGTTLRLLRNIFWDSVISRVTPSAYNDWRIVKADTIDQNPVALRSKHVDMRLGVTVFSNSWLKRLIAGVRKTESKKPLKQAVPISFHMLQSMLAYSAGLPSPAREEEFLNALNFDTASAVAFVGFLCMGEFSVRAKDLRSPNAVDIVASPLLRGDVRFAPDDSHVVLHLRHSKGDIKGIGVEIVLARTSSDINKSSTCPGTLLGFLFAFDQQNLYSMKMDDQ